jgi:hypothetical protein
MSELDKLLIEILDLEMFKREFEKANEVGSAVEELNRLRAERIQSESEGFM